MARNSEKAQSMLYRFRATQASESGLLPTASTRRPKAASTVSTIPACEKFRGQIVREVSRKLLKIQDESLSDAQVRDLNDEINRLMKEKWGWERRIKELGGPSEEEQEQGRGGAELHRKGLDAKYFGWGDDEADGSLLRYERKKEREAEKRIGGRDDEDADGDGDNGNGKDSDESWEPLPGDAGDGIGWWLPTVDEVQAELIERRKRTLLENLST
ncbi:hypothetical protein DV738_g4995, partial [Chaetothyriales sp. CBS 135597]